LRETFRHASFVDLLKSDEFAKYVTRPSALREELIAKGAPTQRWVVIDEVHWLIENRHIRFALCGSSARKVRRGHANLLGGRAVRYELHGLIAEDLAEDFDLTRCLNYGYLPAIYDAAEPRSLLRSYCANYLREEIAAEGLTRNLPAFSRFLEIAALADSELVQFATIARDVGVSAPTVRGYFEILCDTLIGSWLPAFRALVKRRVVESPKFYWVDAGIVNQLARRGDLMPGSITLRESIRELGTPRVAGAPGIPRS